MGSAPPEVSRKLRPMAAREAENGGGALWNRLGGGWWLAAAGLIAVVLGPHLGAGLASDDGAILGFVHREGPLADWHTSQWGLASLKFWRPLVTASFGVQERLFGVWPPGLRLHNLLCHAASAILAGLVARRLGGGTAGAWLAALGVASFPWIGGTGIWVSGRSDAQCLPGLLLAAWGTLARRPGWAIAGALLAVGTKEFGWSAATLATLAAWGAGQQPRQALGDALPVWAVVLGALALRPFLLGDFPGGYESGGGLWAWAALPGRLFAALAPASFAAAGVVALAALLGWRPCARLAGAGMLAALAAGVLLRPMFAEGSISPEHRRLLLVADGSLMVFLGAALGAAYGAAGRRAVGPLGARGRALAFLLLAGSAALLGARAWTSAGDARLWARAGDQAEAEIRMAREGLELLPPVDPEAPWPAFDPRFARVDGSGGAYVLHWGIADRFRAPFPAAPRVVWPWRSLVPGTDPLPWLRGGAGPPWAAEAPPADGLPALEVQALGGRVGPGGSLWLDGGLLEGRGASLVWPAEGEVGRGLEGVLWAVLATEVGHVAAPVSPFPGSGRVELIDVLRAHGQGSLTEALALAADFRLTGAWLELRLLDGTGETVALAGPWRLSWDEELRRLLWP